MLKCTVLQDGETKKVNKNKHTLRATPYKQSAVACVHLPPTQKKNARADPDRAG
jgi:hypothetical protein